MSLLSQAAENPYKPAVIMAGSGETLTYGELVDGMNRLARVLQAHCAIGDRVAMLMENERDYFTVAWGVRRAGLRGVPVNWHLTAAEVAYMVDNSDAVALIVSAGLLDVAEEVRASNDRSEALPDQRCADVVLRLAAGRPGGVVARAAREHDRRQSDALLVGHHGLPQGHQATAAGGAVRDLQ